MKTFLSATVLLLLSLVVSPKALEAQCKGCKNVGGCQRCTTIDPETFNLWEVCYVWWCFCQLEDICSEQEEETLVLEMSPDFDITPAGTFRAEYTPSVSGLRDEPIMTCKGWVVASADPVAQRPQTIVLDSN